METERLFCLQCAEGLAPKQGRVCGLGLGRLAAAALAALALRMPSLVAAA
jgi:hypothetical protein